MKKYLFAYKRGKRIPFTCPLSIVTDYMDCYHGQGGDFRCDYFIRYFSNMSDHPYLPDSGGVICSAPPRSIQLTINFD